MVKETNNYTVFFDFDNTIATCDVFDSLLPVFSRNDFWVELEKKWKKGKIGSRECLAGQIKGMSITRRELDKYLAKIKLDPYFKKLVSLLSKNRVRAFVLSDNFDYILKQVLNYHDINSLKVYSNRLRFVNRRLSPHFPFRSRNCSVCAHCKTKNLLSNVRSGSRVFYIGDGRSDICPAQYADVVFAKDELLKHFKDKKINCFEYKSLKDVYDYFKRRIK